MGLEVGWGRWCESQVGGDADLASACTCMLCDGGVAQQRISGLCQQVCLGESCPPALTLISDASLPPPVSLVPFELLSWCWSTEGVGLSKSPCTGPLREIAWDSSLLLTQPPSALALNLGQGCKTARGQRRGNRG